MTTFTRNWNTSYEQSPADSQDISQGAARIREDKVDTRERLAIDHVWADGVAAPNSEDGYHLQCTFKKRSSDPSTPNDFGTLYTKDHNNGTNTRVELHYRNTDGQVLRMTERGKHPLIITSNAWEKAQYTTEVSLGSGSGAINIDSSLANAFVRTISGASSLNPPTNGVAGKVITLRIIQSGGPHALDLTGQGFRGSPDLDYTSTFPNETIIVMYYGPFDNWVILSISRSIASAV